MKSKLRLVIGFVSLLAVGTVVYLRASATNSMASVAATSTPALESSCCGPDPASVLPSPYSTPAQAPASTPAAVPPPAKN